MRLGTNDFAVLGVAGRSGTDQDPRSESRSIEEQAELIARLSAVLEPLLHDLLTRTVRERRPRRVLDIGCGAGLHLAAMLEAVDIREALAAGRPGALIDRIDLALLANAIYHVPIDERVELLSAVARLLNPGGALVVVTTAAGPPLSSRHLDLLGGHRTAVWSCPPSMCCSVSSARRVCSRTHRSGSVPPALRSSR